MYICSIFVTLILVYIPDWEIWAKGIGRLAPPYRSGSPYALDDFRAEPTVASRPEGRAQTPSVNRYLRHLVCVPWIRLRSSRLPLACDPAPWYALQWCCHCHITVQHQGFSIAIVSDQFSISSITSSCSVISRCKARIHWPCRSVGSQFALECFSHIW